MEEWRLLITAVVTGIAAIFGSQGVTKLLDMRAKGQEAREASDRRDDDELATVRAEYRADKQQLLGDIRELRKELDAVKNQLADTRVELATARLEQDTAKSMYAQLVEAFKEVKQERDEARIQLATLTNEVTAYRKRFGGLDNAAALPPGGA